MRAVTLLAKYGTVEAVSRVYQTPALGDPEQADYLNAAVWVRSEEPPETFQSVAIGEVESALGRVRTENKFAPRTIDVDIMLAGAFVGQIGHRAIPSEEIIERSFVAIPLAEIAPDFLHPVSGERLSEIADRFDRLGLVLREDVVLLSSA